MNTRLSLCSLFLTAILVLQPRLLAQEKSRHTLPDDPMKAWAEVEKVHQALRVPNDWRTHEPTAEQVAEFQKQVRQTAVSFAGKAREFVERFPTNENVGDARITAAFRRQRLGEPICSAIWNFQHPDKLAGGQAR